MVGKTEFMAPLHVLHQHPTSQPKHAVLQYLQTLHLSGTRLLSEITFKSAHLQSDTWSLCATLTLSMHLLQNPHSYSAEELWNRAVNILPELFYNVLEVPSTSEPQNEPGGDPFWAEDTFLAEDAWMPILLFHQASVTPILTPAAWQTWSQIIHKWNTH